mmetsp:Transcript_9844/g.16225  ORF Transcript_9844/g.16225 Transcript_9844/m.16225 type:complete len:117 (+) Transcript_9844:56-406(+)
MLYPLFWLIAGAWNITIALMWNTVAAKDKKLKADKNLRMAVFAFGVGYAMVGFFDWMWWIVPVGFLLKAGVVLDYFGFRFDYEKLRPDTMTYIVLGDLVFVFCFGVDIGLTLAQKR